MFDDKGNTAVYLFYSYVRICSIYRKLNLSQNDIDELVKTKKIEILNIKKLRNIQIFPQIVKN